MPAKFTVASTPFAWHFHNLHFRTSHPFKPYTRSVASPRAPRKILSFAPSGIPRWKAEKQECPLRPFLHFLEKNTCFHPFHRFFSSFQIYICSTGNCSYQFRTHCLQPGQLVCCIIKKRSSPRRKRAVATSSEAHGRISKTWLDHKSEVSKFTIHLDLAYISLCMAWWLRDPATNHMKWIQPPGKVGNARSVPVPCGRFEYGEQDQSQQGSLVAHLSRSISAVEALELSPITPFKVYQYPMFK